MTLEDLLRWEDSVASWRVVHHGPAGVTLGLLRCDGGEEVDRVLTDDPIILAHIGGRSSSDEDVD